MRKNHTLFVKLRQKSSGHNEVMPHSWIASVYRVISSRQAETLEQRRDRQVEEFDKSSVRQHHWRPS